jgi:hypothetical protein
VHLGVKLWPVSSRWFACNCARRTRFEGISGVWPASALPVTRLLEAYGLWNRPCNRQLTQVDGNLSDLIDAAIVAFKFSYEFVAIDLDWLGC